MKVFNVTYTLQDKSGEGDYMSDILQVNRKFFAVNSGRHNFTVEA